MDFIAGAYIAELFYEIPPFLIFLISLISLISLIIHTCILTKKKKIKIKKIKQI